MLKNMVVDHRLEDFPKETLADLIGLDMIEFLLELHLIMDNNGKPKLPYRSFEYFTEYILYIIFETAKDFSKSNINILCKILLL